MPASPDLENLPEILQQRFAQNPHRHPGLSWVQVLTRLEMHPEKWQSLLLMEQTGGQPDVVGQDPASGEILVMDCAPESPAGRRSLCYDHKAWEERKEHRPANNAMDAAAAIGINLLTEDQYRHLQSLGPVDTKTSSWILTPPSIRRLGGALFGDYRYGQVFIYHNGAQSYYAARGFRGLLRI